MTDRQTQKTIAVLSGVTALNAIGGSVYGLAGAPNVPPEWLEGSPFRDYRIPSTILGVAAGGSSAVAAVMAWRSSARAGATTISAGVVLTGVGRGTGGDHRTAELSAAAVWRRGDCDDRPRCKARLANTE